MVSQYNILLIGLILTAIFCCFTRAKIDEQSSDKTTNNSTTINNKNDDVTLSNKKYFNYLRLPEGQCYNCSTYKCTNHKANMGGSEWCIMLFNDALAHCDSDPNCGGYTMTTANWFHEKYDKNKQIAVHLTKAGEKPMVCPIAEWSSYEKQTTTRKTPVVYGRSTCENGEHNTHEKSQNFNYIFVNNSNVANNDAPYLCNNHPNRFDKNEKNCILPITDAMTLCNSDNQCKGFMINTDDNWQKKFLNNGIQAVQLRGQGETYTSGQTWRIFQKQ